MQVKLGFVGFLLHFGSVENLVFTNCVCTVEALPHAAADLLNRFVPAGEQKAPE